MFVCPGHLHIQTTLQKRSSQDPGGLHLKLTRLKKSQRKYFFKCYTTAELLPSEEAKVTIEKTNIFLPPFPLDSDFTKDTEPDSTEENIQSHENC